MRFLFVKQYQCSGTPKAERIGLEPVGWGCNHLSEHQFMKRRFKTEQSVDGKGITITGPWELSVEVDFDDVWHSKVKREITKLCSILNEYWPEDKHEKS